MCNLQSLLSIQVACVQLINTIVITPDDLDFRLHLRNEFMRVGFTDILEVNYACLLITDCLITFVLIGADIETDSKGECRFASSIESV